MDSVALDSEMTTRSGGSVPPDLLSSTVDSWSQTTDADRITELVGLERYAFAYQNPPYRLQIVGDRDPSSLLEITHRAQRHVGPFGQIVL